jgi:acyl-CoA thioesterase
MKYMEMTQEQRQAYYDKLLHSINTRRSYVTTSGIRVTKVAENYCEGELEITPDVCNYWGIVHGGCLATLADSVAGVAACSTGQGTVTVSYGFNFLRPAKGSLVRCVAEPEKIGRTISVFRCTLTDDQGGLVASGLFTFFMTGPLDQKKLGEPAQDESI